MIKTLRERLADFFRPRANHPPLSVESSLHEIALQHSHVFDFVERKYGVKIDAEDKTLSVKEFVEKYGLPPAPVLFMEIQMDTRVQTVRPINASQASELIRCTPALRVLDVREDWETSYGRLPTAQSLKPELLDEILRDWPRDTAILVYCHFGIRSMDAATFLADRGFTQVYILSGGIEAWSLQVDPTMPRYDSAYC